MNLVICRNTIVEQKLRLKEQQIQNQKPNIPQCPTCHSTNIERISSGKKTGGFLGLGVLNSNFKKMFKCNNCGYKW